LNHYGFQVSDLLVCEYQEKYERGLTQIQTQELNSINILLIGLFHSLKWIQPYDLSGFDVQTTYITFDLVKQWIDNSIFAINNDNYSEAIRLLGRLQCIRNVSHSISQPFTDALNLLYKAIKLYRTITSNILLQNLISTLSRIIVKIAKINY
jgi:exonuclease V gamma subunit